MLMTSTFLPPPHPYFYLLIIRNASIWYILHLTVFFYNHWKLSFNELKCILIRFSASCPAVNISYFLNQHQLSVTNSHKDLGSIVSSNLDWTDHYNYISGQAYKIFGLLRRTFSNCNSTHAKKLLYLSLVHPKLTYCSCVWRPHLIKDITTLENI